MNFSGLPFVYAAWVANKPISEAFIREFDLALANGVNNIAAVIEQLPADTGIDLHDYLTHKLDFYLTPEKVTAKDLFLKLIDEL